MDGHLLQLSHLDPFQKWSLICAAALTILYAVMRPMRKKKDPLDPKAPMSLAGQRAVEKQMSELLVALEQMARQMTAQLDTRAAKLEALLREADAKIAILRSSGSAPVMSPAPLPHQSEPAENRLSDPRHAAVYELADRGCSPHEIARELGRPYGEVELILALREDARPLTA